MKAPSVDSYPIAWITKYVGAGYAPRSEEHLQDIYTAGIRSIVNLCAECYDLHEAEEKYGFKVYYLPVPDEYAPDLESLIKLIEWVDQEVDQKRKTLVHCRFGVGRTGTVLTAYLFHLGYSREEAEDILSPTPSRPSTNTQTRLLAAYCKRLKINSPAKLNRLESSDSSGSRYFDMVRSLFSWPDK